MKRIIKTYFKIFIFLFGISLLLVNCEKEEIPQEINEVVKKDKIKEHESEFTIRNITREEIQQNEVISSKLRKLEETLTKEKEDAQNREVYSSEYDFTIDTDFAKYIESADGIYHSYTFPIVRTEDNGLLENLFLSLQDDGTYATLIVTYELTEEEIENIGVGVYPSDFEDKVIYTEINDENLLTDIFSRYQISCADIVWQYCTGDAQHPGGVNPDGSPCPAVAYMNVTVCQGGYGGDGTSGGDDTSQGGDTSGGGTGTTGGSNDDDPYYYITTPTPPTLAEILSVRLGELTEEQIAWANNGLNRSKVLELIVYLNSCEAVAAERTISCVDIREFSALALETSVNGGEVDFALGVFKDQTFVNSQLDCIYEKLKRANSSEEKTFVDKMLEAFDGVNPTLTFSIGTTPNSTDWAFTKGEVLTFGSNTLESYEIINSQNAENSSNLDKMVGLSHELIHAFMFQTLEDMGIIEFNSIGQPMIINPANLCQNATVIPNINLNTLSEKKRWTYLLCEIYLANQNNFPMSWTHTLFNSSAFSLESYRELLEQLLIDKHDWDSEPLATKNFMIQLFGANNWKQKVAEYMSWTGLEDTPEFTTWLATQNSFTTPGFPTTIDLFSSAVTKWWVDPAEIANVLSNCN